MFAERLVRMLSACHRSFVGARLSHLKSATRCLSSNAATLAGPLPALKANGLILTTRAVPCVKHYPLHSFSTSSIFCYDKEVLTEVIRTSTRAFKPKTYFIDLKEDDKGERYLKITEKSNGKKSGKCAICKYIVVWECIFC